MRILGCVVAELLEGRGQRVGGGLAGPDLGGERFRLVGVEGGIPQRAAKLLELAVVDAAEVGRLEPSVRDQLGDGWLTRCAPWATSSATRLLPRLRWRR
jgi:hypothetical protein